MTLARLTRSRGPLALALFAGAAASGLLGACTPKNPLAASPSVQVAAGETTDGAVAVSRWAEAYAKSPQDPRVAVGYARALKGIGSKDKAFDVLKTAHQRDRDNAELASELGRLALDIGRLEVAKASLEAAEAQGARDWRTLSAQGTLAAKQGQHGAAQHYYLAALQQKPDAVSVINNLALSYALDGKADKAASLLRKTVAAGNADRRVRQNLALVLGLDGKFDEARQLAAVDMPAANAQASMSYLRNMVSAPGNVAALEDGEALGDEPLGAGEWQPYAEESEPARQAATANASAPVSVWKANTISVEPAPGAVAAQVATLAPSEGGSTTVAKSPPKPKTQAPTPVTPTVPAEPAVFRATVE
jgi:Flp pilus assembly protein TadD